MHNGEIVVLDDVQKKYIFDNTPSSVTVRSEAFTFAKRYGNQFDFSVYPAITLTYVMQDTPAEGPINDKRRKTNHLQEDFTGTGAADEFQLSYDAREITYVKYVSGSTWYIWKKGDPNPTNFFTQPSADIAKMTNIPDISTNVTVYYKMDGMVNKQGYLVHDTLQIDVYSKDEVKGAKGISGAILTNEMAFLIKKWFVFNYEYDYIVARVVTPIRDLSKLTGEEGYYRKQFDVLLYHSVNADDEEIGLVETVDYEVILDV